MATTLSPGTFSSFANISQTSTPGGCAPCTSAQLLDLWRGSWTQNSSLPAIRTLQPILDPVYNTTSVSTICNTAALTAYDNSVCQHVMVDDNCDLVCVDGNGVAATAPPFTITFSGTSGQFIQFTNTFRIQGGVSTTDSNGAFTCLTSTDATLPGISYTYAGPTSVTQTGMNLLIMPELTDYYPGEGLFEQCTLFQTGPPPVALTPANQIILPVLTLPGAGTTTTQSPTTTPNPPTTTPRPADTGTGTTPPQTSGAQTTATDSAAPPEETDNSPAPPSQTTTPEEPENEPTVTSPEGPDSSPSATTAPDGSNDETSETTTSQGSGSPPVQSDNTGGQGGQNPVTTTQVSTNPPAQSDGAEEQEDESDTSPSIVIPTQADDDVSNTAGQPQGPGASTSPQGGSGVPVIPATTAIPTTTTLPVAIVPGVTFENDGSSSMIVVGGSTTIVAGGAAAVGSGTTFSVLPSAGGIAAAADGSTSTLPLPAPVTSTPATATLPVAIVPGVTLENDGSSSQIVVGGSITIVAGGAAAVGSGTTFSVLPSAGGIVAVADGTTSTVPLPAPITAAEQGSVRPLTTSTQGFALPGPMITGGGEIVSISGTTFSALPSGLGVVVASDGGPTTTVQPSQLASLGISTVSGNPEAYVLPGQTLAAGGTAAVISGATYSVLPQGDSIQVVSDRRTSVVAITEATGIPGIGEISVVDTEAEGYVLDGSITVIAGGAAATISGVVYSALPSGLGVVVNDSDEFASYIEQGISGSESDEGGDAPYIIGGTSLPSAGGSAVTVSGVVYSALPSGSGVLIVAGGESTTIGLSSTTSTSGGEAGTSATAGTSGSDAEESTAPSTGVASSTAALLTRLSGCGFVGVIALLIML